ncbi:hypothetical protein [Paenibacillus alba]|uniref:Uncharacterized protein n=1 Tax=Paenibacillus alba TaxID=1197127 RepID=A0ABU6GGR1_9BACL|nr:hypothetical protein [Paenibacillus alba]MEC0231928.1 hypothetical protein [Paenibacillus alba]
MKKQVYAVVLTTILLIFSSCANEEVHPVMRSGEDQAVREEKLKDSGDTEVVSPDGKHIYVVNLHMEGENLFAKHTIRNSISGQSVPIALDLVSGYAVWLDNEHVLYIGGIGEEGVTQIDMQGQMTSMPALSKIMAPTDLKQTERATIGNDRLYYLETNYPRNIHDLKYIELSQMDAPAARQVRGQVSLFQPMKAGHMISVVTTRSHLDELKQELILIDSNGKEQGAALAIGAAIGPMAWSPDESELAYGMLEKAGSTYQISVFDLKAGSSSVVFEGSRLIGDLLWSPDSTRLWVTIDRSKDGLERQFYMETSIRE